MLVTIQHVLAHIPKAELWPFLIGFPFNLRVLYFLQVELRHLDGGAPNRQETMNQLDRFQMRFDQMSNGRGQPALRLSSIEQPTRPIAGFAIPPRTAELTTRGK